MTVNKRVLLLSAYDADSHRYWHETLRAGLPNWDWQLLSLPARHFSWRIRGNPLLWMLREKAVLQAPYDLLLATSMVDLATLRGLVPALARLPTLLYFHENQFAYPSGRGPHGLLEAQMVSLYSALAADQLLFNSDYNRSTFLSGCRQLLKRLPDKIPTAFIDDLAAKSQLLPVPFLAAKVEPLVLDSERLQIVWNHRWEYDKGIADLLELMQKLLATELAFTLHVVGQQFREIPEEFARLHSCLQQHGALGQWGYVEDRGQYLALLAGCDVVLSTAQHEFQGLAVIEAVAQGCAPVVPDALAYPEWFAPEHCYASLDDALARLLALGELKRQSLPLPNADVSALSSDMLLPHYERVLRSQLSADSVL